MCEKMTPANLNIYTQEGSLIKISSLSSGLLLGSVLCLFLYLLFNLKAPLKFNFSLNFNEQNRSM